MRTILKFSIAAAMFAPVFSLTTRAAEDWPHWLGPKGDNIVRETGLLDQWPDSGPAKVWTQKAGAGFSSPIAFEGKVYCFYQGGADNDKETLTAFDAATGAPAWTQTYEINNKLYKDYQGTRATPAIDNGKIYTYGGTGILVGRNLADGKELWRLDVLKELGATLLGQQWGEASSPLVSGDAVYVQGGKGGAVAISVAKDTGKILWKSQASGVAGYASIVEADVQGKKQLVVLGGEALYGMDPATGKTLWQQPWKTSYDVNASTPIVHDGKLFVTSGYYPQTARCALYQLSPTGAKVIWEKKASEGGIGSRFQPAILDDGFVYGNSEEKRGSIKCLKWATGELQWEAKSPHLGFGGSILRVDQDKLIAMSQDGKLSLLLATPQKEAVISEFELFSGYSQIWSTPLVYNGNLYAKGKDELVCLKISK